MTYEEFLRNWFVETNNNLENEYGEMFNLWEDFPFTNALEAAGWTVENASDMTTPVTKSKGSASVTAMFEYNGSWKSIESISITADGVDVASEEIGTIDAVDALLGTGLDAASKKAEELKKRKLVTVANLQKALEDYDERKGTAVEDGEPVNEKNKVFIDGSGRVYAKYIQLAQQSALDSEKSDRQLADRDLSAEIAKKADKEHTHKAADITDLPNYARSVNGEEPDADGNVEIDIDAVVEVAELPGETKKKVYLVPEKEEQSVSVDCSSVESMMAAVADWLSGEGGHSFSTPAEFLQFMMNLETDKGKIEVFQRDNRSNKYVEVSLFDGFDMVVDGETTKRILIDRNLSSSDGCLIKGNAQQDLSSDVERYYFSIGGYTVYNFSGTGKNNVPVDTGWVRIEYGQPSIFMYILDDDPTPSTLSLIDRRTPPAVYAKSVELATKEALSEATSGADEKAAALGERIGAVESSVATAKSDIAAMKSDISTAKTNITTMKSNITEAQANITTAQGDITKAQGDIEAVTSEVETVKADVAALGKKVVRSVNGTEPDENGNVEVAASSGASGKNDTITVSDTDSAISDNTGILSGESKENPKGLLRFAASKFWDYIRGKIASVLKISYENGYAIINEDAIIKGSIETPNFHINGDGLIYSSVVRRGTKTFTSSGSGENEVHVVFDKIKDDDYVLFFEITRGAEWISCPIQVSNKGDKGFDITVYTNKEDETITFEYTAFALH